MQRWLSTENQGQKHELQSYSASVHSIAFAFQPTRICIFILYYHIASTHTESTNVVFTMIHHQRKQRLQYSQNFDIIVAMTQTATPILSDILSELMFEKRIKMIDLAHQTGVPQSTLSRILSGETTHPHRSSLEPLATFFQVSLNQLLGRDPIGSLRRVSGSMGHSPRVPLLAWEQITPWLAPNPSFAATDSVQVDVELAAGSFAAIVDDTAMEPQFPSGTMLIVDSQKTPKDRSFVIASLGDSHKVIFRQLLTDGIHRYLRPLNPDFSQFGMITLTDSDKVVGVVLQARKNYLE